MIHFLYKAKFRFPIYQNLFLVISSSQKFFFSLRETVLFSFHYLVAGKSSPSTNNHVKGGSPLNCPLCYRECKHFHYLKGHISVHFRQKIKEQVSSWGGGLGESSYICQICNYVASSVDSLATHAGYKHSLFYGYMSEEMQKESKEVADKVGEALRYVTEKIFLYCTTVLFGCGLAIEWICIMIFV